MDATDIWHECRQTRMAALYDKLHAQNIAQAVFIIGTMDICRAFEVHILWSCAETRVVCLHCRIHVHNSV
jgi:hypothetical protein